MRSPFLFVFCGLLVFASAFAENDLARVVRGGCTWIGKLQLDTKSCKTGFTVPTAKVRQGWTTGFTTDWCKTKKKLPYGLGTVCVPGTRETRIYGPAGVDFGTKTISLCDLVKTGLGAKYNDIVSRGAAMCKCLPEAFAQFDLKEFSSMLSQTTPTAALTSLTAKQYKLQVCMTGAALQLQDNKARLTAEGGDLAPTDTVRIFKAAEIDLVRYISFAEALSPCFVATCDLSLISAWFQRWLTDSETLLLDQLKETIKPWSDAFVNIEDQFSSLGTSTKAIADKITEMQSQSASIFNDICPDANACAKNTLADFKQTVGSTLDLTKEIAETNALVVSTIADARTIVDFIESAEKAFEAVSDLSIAGIVDQVVSGKFRSMEDLAGALKAAQRLPEIVDHMQNTFDKFLPTINGVADRGPKFVNNMQTILARNWLVDYKGDAATANKLNDGVFKIQEMFAGLIPQATQIYTSVKYLTASVSSVTSTGRIGQLDLKVASYSTWTKGSITMPCLKTGRKRIVLIPKVLEPVLDYPQFYSCRQPYVFPFPNQHIPYLRLTFPKDSSLAKFGQPVKADTTSISWSGQKQSASSTQISSSTSASSAASSAVSAAVSSDSSTSDTSTSTTSSSTTTSTVDTSSQAANIASSAAPSITGARRRAIPFGRRQEGVDGDTPPPDEVVETSIIPGFENFYTDRAEAEAQATTSAPPTTAVFVTGTVAGTATLVQNPQITATGTNAPTETVTDDAVKTVSLNYDGEIGVYNDLATTSASEVVSSYEQLGTVSVKTADPTVSTTGPGVSTTAAVASPTTSKQSGGVRMEAKEWLIAVIAVCAGILLV